MKYGSVLTLCKKKDEVVQREQLCDGAPDCEDKTDEQNCTQRKQNNNSGTAIDYTLCLPEFF